jgi:hypothetical protein
VYALLAQRLFDRATMLLALLFLLVGSPELYASYLFMSRQVLGEIPALAYAGLGMLLLLRAVDARRLAWAPMVLAGLAWGIAMTTKSQIMILLPAAIALVWLLDRVYYRQLAWHALAVPMLIALGCVGLWYGAQVAIAGPEQFRLNAQVLRQGGAIHILGFSLAHVRNALGVIWHAGFLLWGLPGLLWGAWLARERSRAGLRQALLLALPGAALIWFVLLSVGWGRYAFYPFILAPIWTANLLVVRGRAAAQRGPRWQIALAGLALAGLLMWNGRPFFGQLLAAQQDDFAAMRQYLATQIPAGALIETWEWEISLDARQPIHHPTTSVTNAFTDYMMGRLPIPPGLYVADQARPAYILEGTFGRWTTIYDAFLAQHGQLIVEYGEYALYRVSPDSAPAR